MQTKTSVLLAAALILACLGGAAHAGSRKTDVITLYNGDRVTGEIKSLAGGILQLSTESMGTLKIEWPDIARLESEYYYEVRLSDGQRLYGSFLEDSRAGQMVLLDLSGEHALESLQVVEIRPIEDDFWERLDIYLATTVSYAKASKVGQVAFNTDISYEDQRSTNRFTGRVDTTTTDDKDSSATRLALNRSTWSKRRTDIARNLFASFESNDQLDLNSRVAVGAGAGRYIVDTHAAQLIGATGLQVITEDNQHSGSNQDVELYFGARFATWKFNTPELDLDLTFELYPSLTDPGRVRSSTNLRLRWEIVEDLFWDVSAWATTDNEAETGSSSDYSVTTGIGWEY